VGVVVGPQAASTMLATISSEAIINSLLRIFLLLFTKGKVWIGLASTHSGLHSFQLLSRHHLLSSSVHVQKINRSN
jgi:hypothetical protein